MRFTGFIGPSYTLQSVNADCQRCVNLYPELNEVGTGKNKEIASLVSTPGLRFLNTLNDTETGNIRGLYTASNGELFAVRDNKFYRIGDDWEISGTGTINTNLGPVSFADNGITVVVVDGQFGYGWDIDAETFTQITDEDFLGADQVTFQDQYFIFNKPDTEQFYISDLSSTDFSATDIATAEGSPDKLLGLISVQRNLYLFGSKSTEVFYNSGNSDFPFERIQGAFLPIGIVAPFSIGTIQGAVYWMGCDNNGAGTIYRMQGYQPSRISTFAIEKVISELGDLSDARAWTYQQSGHSFYCINLPGADSTWVFDVTTSLWHERARLVLGELQQHQAVCHAYAYGTNVVGVEDTANIYALDREAYDDDGETIQRLRSAPHISADMKRLFYEAFQLDMETGVGVDGGLQGENPKAMLQYSDDGGHTWSDEVWADIGPRGNRRARVIFRRLGSSYDRVFRIKITDPIKVTLLGAQVDVVEELP